MTLDEGITVILQKSDVRKRDIQEPKYNIRTFLIDHHNVIDPDDESDNCSQHDKNKAYDQFHVGDIKLSLITLQGRLHIIIEVLQHKACHIRSKYFSFELLYDISLNPDKSSIEPHCSYFSIFMSQLSCDIWIELKIIIINHQSLIFIDLWINYLILITNTQVDNAIDVVLIFCPLHIILQVACQLGVCIFGKE